MSTTKPQPRVKILSSDEKILTLELSGFDVSVVNALRRVMISEVPTIAIDQVEIKTNTSIMYDEMLSHRIGLVPLKIPSSVKMDQAKDITFQLFVKTGADEVRTVYVRDLVWIPPPSDELNPDMEPPTFPFPNIILLKLGPNQEIDLKCICEVDVGRTHAKWSPVATAYYRLLPDISVSNKLPFDKLKQVCPSGVFEQDMEDLQIHPEKCTLCRECVNTYPEEVTLHVTDKYILHVESSGVYEPSEILLRALGVIMDKCIYTTKVLSLK